MSALLEILGSFVLSGLIILQVLGYQMVVSDNLAEVTGSVSLLRLFAGCTQALEHDLSRCGFLVRPAERFTVLEPQRLEFLTAEDANHDGFMESVRSVRYELVDPQLGLWGDRPAWNLVRRVDGGQEELLMPGVSSLTFRYLDSRGEPVTAGDAVRMIEIEVTFLAPFESRGGGTELLTYRKRIRPLNLF
jgi:hypothetical protein